MPTNISLLLQCAPDSSQTEQATQYLSQAFGISQTQLLKSPDFHLLNSDQNAEEFSPLSIEQVRDLQAELTMHPYQGIGPDQLAIFIICKIELASLPAQNALLKAIEEPPARVKLILTSTQPQQVLPTILSRCQLIQLATAEAVPASTTAEKINLQQLSRSSYTDLMTIAEKYKEKSEAQEFLAQLTTQLHQTLQSQPSGQLTNLVQHTILTSSYLRKNVNPRLALEELLFQFKSL